MLLFFACIGFFFYSAADGYYDYFDSSAYLSSFPFLLSSSPLSPFSALPPWFFFFFLYSFFFKFFLYFAVRPSGI
jgi:hypothetical protein